ncbi:MAG: hypothetical protein Kow0077_07380 [Anaerolineae bacterium]
MELGAPDHERKRLVTKIPCLPETLSPTDQSLTDEDLIVRGQREYDSLERVYTHFSTQKRNGLAAVRPEAYLPEINAVIMEFVPGPTLYDRLIAPRHLLSSRGRKRALNAVRSAGRWLGWLHTLQVTDRPGERIKGVRFALHELQREAQQLKSAGIVLEELPHWETAMRVFEGIEDDTLVWSHGDFHMRNVFVLPDDSILGFDTALDFLDHPCVDIGKFFVDLETRRTRILSYGMLPPEGFVQQLQAAFLDGYGKPVDPLVLALYRGQFLLEKWNQVLPQKHETPAATTMATETLIRTVTTPFFNKQVEGWLQDVHRPTG